MTDIAWLIERLREANFEFHKVGESRPTSGRAETTVNTLWHEAASALASQQERIAELEKDRARWMDTASGEIKVANYRLREISQQAATIAALTELLGDAAHRLRTYVGAISRTHWEGCDEAHNDCGLLKRIDAALAERYIKGRKT